MKQRPFLIGLTGNIATGKSEVARILAGLGARIIDADHVAHQVIEPGGPAYFPVVEAFGPDILVRPDQDTGPGTIDRAKLGDIVFRDPEALRRLEAIVHPAVIVEVDRQIARSTEPVVVVEAIKLIEAGMHRQYDTLWVVTAPRQLQIARLVSGRQMTEAEAAVRIDAQPPQAEKATLADHVIVNDGDLDALRRNVASAWAQMQLPVQEASVRPARRDDIHDAAGVAAVLNSVIAEGRFTALTGHFSPEEEMAFLQGLGPRSELYVAEEVLDDPILAGRITAFQVIEPFATHIPTMGHVCQMATYVNENDRGQGIGRQLAKATLAFARASGYEKAVVYVLATNEPGQAYYQSLGFEPRGTLTRQVKIDDAYHDEIFMELLF
jgi:dephospho-CoA kinase